MEKINDACYVKAYLIWRVFPSFAFRYASLIFFLDGDNLCIAQFCEECVNDFVVRDSEWDKRNCFLFLKGQFFSFFEAKFETEERKFFKSHNLRSKSDILRDNKEDCV